MAAVGGVLWWLLFATAVVQTTTGLETSELSLNSLQDEDILYNVAKDEATKDSELLRWLAAANWATAMEIKPIQRVAIPVRLNVLLIGFDDHGPYSMDISEQVLRPYLEHVETSLRHSFVAVDANGMISSNRQIKRSVVEYEYRIHVMKLGHIVAQVFEAAINTFLRRVNGTNAYADFQIDVDRIWPLYESLLHTLGLKESYSLLIVNPTKSLREDLKYGYRSGFSADEIRQIATDSEIKKIVKAINTVEDKNRPDEQRTFMRNQDDDDHEASRADIVDRPIADQGIHFEEIMVQADTWAKDFLTKNRMILTQQKQPSSPSSEECPLPMTILLKDPNDQDHHKSSGHLINMKPSFTLVEAVDTIMNTGSELERARLRYIVDGGNDVHESCIVDNWVGRGRASFIDLAAGPFSRGSEETKSYVDTNIIYPKLRDTVLESLRRYQWGKGKVSDVQRSWHGGKRSLLQADDDDYAIPPDDWMNPEYSPDNFNDVQDTDVKIGQSGSTLEAELQIYKNFIVRNCDEDVQPVTDMEKRVRGSCDNIRKKIKELEEAMKSSGQESNQRIISGVHDEQVENEPQREERVNDTPEEASLSSLIAGHHAAALEEFGSKMGNIVSRTLRLLVTPPTAQPLSKLDFPVSIPSTISFNVFMIVGHNNAYKHLGSKEGGFDFPHFQQEIRRLSLPDQEFVFSLHELSLTDEPHLAMTYWSAIHTAVVPVVTNTSEVISVTRMYLDSEHLRHHLTQATANRAKGTGLYKVSIFIFAVDFKLPLLIDLHRQATAVDNFVVGVQSNFGEFVTQDSCNHQPIVINLRDPTKAIIAATAQVIGGILPSHVTSEPEGVMHYYLCAVGNAPNVMTSPQSRLTGLQVDIAHRHWLALRLDAIASKMNEIIERLAEVSTTMLSKRYVSKIREIHSDIVRSLQTLADHAALLDFTKSFEMVSRVEVDMQQLDNVTQVVARHLVQKQCQQKHKPIVPLDENDWIESMIPLLSIVVIDLLLLLLFLLCRSNTRKTKVKIN